MKQIDKNIFWLGWVSFFTDFASSMVTVILPLYIVYVLHEGMDKLGLVLAIASFVSYGFRILFGYISDRLGLVKPLIVAGYALSSLSKPLFGLASSYSTVAMVSALERLGKAIRSAPKDTLISAYAKQGDTGKSFGFHKMLDISGELGGALLLTILFYFYSEDLMLLRALFFWTLLPSLIAMAIVLFLVKDKAGHAPKPKVFEKADWSLLPLLSLYFFFLFFLLNDQFLIIKAKEAGYSMAHIPLLVILFTLTQALSSYFSGIYIDKKGSFFMLTLAYILALLSMVCLFFGFIAVAFILLAFFTVISLNATRAYIAHQAKAQGALYGIFYAGVAIASALSSLVMGWVWEHRGFEMMMYLVMGGLFLVTMIWMGWTLMHKGSTQHL